MKQPLIWMQQRVSCWAAFGWSVQDATMELPALKRPNMSPAGGRHQGEKKSSSTRWFLVGTRSTRNRLHHRHCTGVGWYLDASRFSSSIASYRHTIQAPFWRWMRIIQNLAQFNTVLKSESANQISSHNFISSYNFKVFKHGWLYGFKTSPMIFL